MIHLSEIIQVLKEKKILLQVHGDYSSIKVKYLRPAELSDEFTLDWIGKSKKEKQRMAELSPAQVIICDPTVLFSETIQKQHKVLIHVENPKLAVAIAGNSFFVQLPEAGIHSSAVIHPEAIIDSTVSIGANCAIGQCNIGAHTVIYPNTVIYDHVTIGMHCIVHSGVVIGTDGLGCERLADGTLVKFPHLGGVAIHNHVEVGANCQIAKGALTDTIIGEGTKINGMCFIAHNCVLGKNVWITGNTMLAGTVKVEDNVTIYSGVLIREQKHIGRNAIIGMGSVVTKDIPEGETWIGSPAHKFEKS